MTVKATTTSRMITSICSRNPGPARLMKAVRRMCALRRIASTAPSAESQTKSVDANSSAQIRGLWKR